MSEFRIDGKQVPNVARWELALAYHEGRRVEWNGTYEDYLRTNLWCEHRERILDRDGRRCRLCANPERLTVHHSSYAFIGGERDQDVITLCEPCHYEFHRWRKRPRHIGTIVREVVA